MNLLSSLGENGLDEYLAKFLYPDILGNSAEFLEVLKNIYVAAMDYAPVFIEGETGTGKTLYSRKMAKFNLNIKNDPVVLDCSLLHDEITLSILQGHIRGAFTGAYNDKIGVLEESHGGVLIIENIDKLSCAGQATIARFIDDGTLQRLGDSHIRKINSKLIMTSTGNFDSSAIDKKLYFRLLKYKINLPPLRNMNNDLALISKQFCEERLNSKISPKSLRYIQKHDWPGNFRELFSCLEIFSNNPDSEINECQLLNYIKDVSGQKKCLARGDPGSIDFLSFDLDTYLLQKEKFIIESALEQSNGVQSNAAKLLGIKERSLWHRIKTLGIRVLKV